MKLTQTQLKKMIIQEMKSVLKEGEFSDREEKALKDFHGALIGLGILTPKMDNNPKLARMYDKLKDLSHEFMEQFDVELGGYEDDEESIGSFQGDDDY